MYNALKITFIFLLTILSITTFAQEDSIKNEFYISPNKYFKILIPYTNRNGEIAYYNNVKNRSDKANDTIIVNFEKSFFQTLNPLDDGKYRVYTVMWRPFKSQKILDDRTFYNIAKHTANTTSFQVISRRKLNINNKAAYQVISSGNQSGMPVIIIVTFINFKHAFAEANIYQERDLKQPISSQIDWHSYNRFLLSLDTY